jgi:hypothetical protein
MCHMDIVHLIQSAVAPVFLLSGVGVTLGVLTNRLARIVDRARALEDQVASTAIGPNAAPEATARRKSLETSLRVLARRAHYINVAITLSTLSALLVALVVILLFAGAFLKIRLEVAIAAMFIASMVMLTGAFFAFLIEVRLATASLRIGAPDTPPGDLYRS